MIRCIGLEHLLRPPPPNARAATRCSRECRSVDGRPSVRPAAVRPRLTGRPRSATRRRRSRADRRARPRQHRILQFLVKLPIIVIQNLEKMNQNAVSRCFWPCRRATTLRLPIGREKCFQSERSGEDYQEIMIMRTRNSSGSWGYSL